MKQLVLCTWCRGTRAVKSALEAEVWLRTHDCPMAPKPDGDDPKGASDA